MSMFKIAGLKDATPSSYPTVPAGRYTVRIIEVKTGETGAQSKYPGTPKLQLKAVIIDGEHKEHKLTFGIVIPSGVGVENDPEYLANRLGQLAKFLVACGIDYTKGGFDPEDLNGVELIVAVDLKTDANGEKQNNVKNWLCISK